MAGVFADNTDNAFAANDAAEFAERFDRGTYTHGGKSVCSPRGGEPEVLTQESWHARLILDFLKSGDFVFLFRNNHEIPCLFRKVCE